MIVAATYPFASALRIRTRTPMTTFAIDDRLDDVGIHLGGRFDPRHLGSYLCPMEELAVGRRHPTPRKTVKFPLSLPDVQCP